MFTGHVNDNKHVFGVVGDYRFTGPVDASTAPESLNVMGEIKYDENKLFTETTKYIVVVVDHIIIIIFYDMKDHITGVVRANGRHLTNKVCEGTGMWKLAPQPR